MRRNILAVSWLKRSLALLVALAVIAAPRVYASADTPPPPDGELPENAAEEPVDETEEETGDETEPPYVWLPQSEFGFSDPCPPDIRYNANGNIFVNPAVGEASGSETVYSIVDGAAAVIDPATGVLTIISAGTVTVRAYREGDETYLPACAEYTLTVLRADRSLAFDKPGANCAYYGVGFENAASPDAGSGAITYSVVSGGDIASVDPQMGALRFADGRVGEIEIRADIDEDDRYFGASASYTLNVSYLPAPESPYSLDGERKNDSGWYTGPVTVTPAEGYAISLSNALSGNVWSDSLTVSADTEAGLELYLMNTEEPAAGAITDVIAVAPEDMKIDMTHPTELSVEYGEGGVWSDKLPDSIMFGFFSRSVTVTLCAFDGGSGIERFEWSCAGQESEENSGIISPDDAERFTPDGEGRVRASFKLPAVEFAQCRGNIVFTVTDRAGNAARYEDERVVVVDSVGPSVEISFDGPLAAVVSSDGAASDMPKPDASSRFVYRGGVAARVKVAEANFFPEIMDIEVSRDGERLANAADPEWTQSGDGAWTAELRFDGDGEYVLSVRCSDMSGNPMEWRSGEYGEKSGEYEYVSNVLSIDTTPPVISRAESGGGGADPDVYAQARSIEIVVTDRNFRPDGFELSVLASDIGGDPASGFDAGALRELKKQWEQWTPQEPGVWRTTVVFDADARYTFNVSCTDIAGNRSEEHSSESFVVDMTAPEPEGLSISYSEPAAEALIGGVTFNYYGSKVTVTLRAEDHISGIERFDWRYARENGASAANVETASGVIEESDVVYEDSGAAAVASFELPAGELSRLTQHRGGISFTVTDRAGNVSELYDGAASRILVVDSVAPELEVTYSQPRQAVDNTLYYDGRAIVTLEITEANFYAEDVEISVNGSPLPEAPVWRQSGDTHTAQLPVDGDGEYTVEVRYADRSKNAFDVFTSEIIVIDTAEPVIEVRYVPEEYASEDGGRRYYGQPVTAEITVTERNFRAQDMRAAITAADIVGADVNGSLISELAEYLTRDGSWTRRGDRSTATVVFDADANYAFGIEYTDLASHGAAYGTDSFTVDMTPPSAPEVTYAESVYTDILSAMTLGYYNAPVRVSVSVDDATAGVSRIVYSFTDANGAPRGEEFVIEVDGITYSNGGRTASASFYAPRAETQGGQFDGAVEILAFDRAGNGSGRAGERRIIVDSIAPELSVAYSEPYGARGGALYYPGDIDVTLRVRESNFDPGDVAVTVTFDGRESAAAPSWSGSGGVYAGVFTLSGDGVRTVSVRYTDRSENAMAAYTSDRLVIDTRPPEITLEGVNNETAYNGETVGFTLTVSDANLDADLNAVALRAVTRAPDGRFETYDVPLGEPEAAPDGTSFVYTAPNLEPDGIYTLTAGAADLSGNGARGISERSGGQLVRELVFSVNRHGAAFMPDADTAAITDAYYVREVTRDLRVAATDVSPLVSYSVLLGDAPLSEGVHYTVERSGGGEQWSRYDFIISKSLFEDEGTYNVVIASSDGADNNDFSDIKGVRLEFTVDRTPPALTVSGLVSGGRYKANTQAVTVIPRDDGGRLGRLRITLSDRRGAPVDTGSDGEPGVLIDLSGDALFDRLESGGGMITLRIPSGVGMSVDVLCEDVSVDALGEPNRYTSRFEDITVSDSGVVMFFAGGLLPILAAGGALASVAAGVTATALRFRKKRRIA